LHGRRHGLSHAAATGWNIMRAACAAMLLLAAGALIGCGNAPYPTAYSQPAGIDQDINASRGGSIPTSDNPGNFFSDTQRFRDRSYNSP